jgi:hypothetical protein
MLPSFTLWHDVQDPSVSLRGRMLAEAPAHRIRSLSTCRSDSVP